MTEKKLDMLYTPGQAIAYINSHLPAAERWSERSAYQSLDYHRRQGNIHAAENVTRGDGEPYLYPESSLDNFLATRRKPGGQWADASTIEGRLGLVSDMALAAEAGISVAAVRRARVARGIAPVSKPGRPRKAAQD